MEIIQLFFLESYAFKGHVLYILSILYFLPITYTSTNPIYPRSLRLGGIKMSNSRTLANWKLEIKTNDYCLFKIMINNCGSDKERDSWRD